MTTKYKHLQPEDRITIATLHQQRYRLNAIAAQLERNSITISRKFKRNCGDNGYALMPLTQELQKLLLQCSVLHADEAPIKQ